MIGLAAVPVRHRNDKIVAVIAYFCAPRQRIRSFLVLKMDIKGRKLLVKRFDCITASVVPFRLRVLNIWYFCDTSAQRRLSAVKLGNLVYAEARPVALRFNFIMTSTIHTERQFLTTIFLSDDTWRNL